MKIINNHLLAAEDLVTTYDLRSREGYIGMTGSLYVKTAREYKSTGCFQNEIAVPRNSILDKMIVEHMQRAMDFHKEEERYSWKAAERYRNNGAAA